MVEAAETPSPGRVRLTLRDMGEKKVRLEEIAENVLGMPLTELEVTRLAMYGLRDGRWVEPVDAREKCQAASLRV
jgi:hypothetical protein